VKTPVVPVLGVNFCAQTVVKHGCSVKSAGLNDLLDLLTPVLGLLELNNSLFFWAWWLPKIGQHH